MLAGSIPWRYTPFLTFMLIRLQAWRRQRTTQCTPALGLPVPDRHLLDSGGVIGPVRRLDSRGCVVLLVLPRPFPHLSVRWYTEALSKTDRPRSLQESLRALPPDHKLALVA